MVFTVIAPAPSLADSARQIAIESGPPFVDVPGGYAVLLDQSGSCLQERPDLTTAFLQSMRAHVEGMQARADALAVRSVVNSGHHHFMSCSRVSFIKFPDEVCRGEIAE
jgi:hypothetical protein